MASEIDCDYGFIGVGAMGWPMAYRLRTQIPKQCTLYITDVAQGPMDKLVAEGSKFGDIKICKTAKEVTEKAVSSIAMVFTNLRILSSQSSPGQTMSAKCTWMKKAVSLQLLRAIPLVKKCSWKQVQLMSSLLVTLGLQLKNLGLVDTLTLRSAVEFQVGLLERSLSLLDATRVRNRQLLS